MLRIKRRRTQARCDINGNPRYNTMNATPLQSVYKNCNTYLNLMCGRPSAVPIVKNRTPKGNEATCTGKRGCMINNCSCNVKFDEDGEFKISYIPNYHSSSDVSNNMINGCCKGTPYRNPILGYRKQLFCGYTCNVDGEQTDNSSDCAKKPTNTVYKDPYAKSCGGARASVATDSACYQPVIRRIQNRNGFVNDQYNYSTKQYLNRRCRTYRQQAFNFLSSKPLQTITTTKCNRGNHQYATRCHGSTSTLGEGNDSNNKPQCIIDCSNCIVGCKPGQKCTGQVKCAGYSLCDTKNNNCCATYKPNNSRFSRQGAVSGGSRINRLKYQTQLRAAVHIYKYGYRFICLSDQMWI